MTIDYRDMPELPRSGFKGENGKMLTLGLFVETAPTGTEHRAIYTLGEKEVVINGKIKPSAWMIYINCQSDYEAMRKLVGNPKQWEMLKQLKWFQENLVMWQYEQKQIQKAIIQECLNEVMLESEKGATAVSAAKALLLHIEGKPQPVETPKKTAAKIRAVEVAEKVTDEFEEDVARMGSVVALR